MLRQMTYQNIELTVNRLKTDHNNLTDLIETLEEGFEEVIDGRLLRFITIVFNSESTNDCYRKFY